MEGPKGKFQILVNTGGSCFLCLSASKSSPLSLKLLSRYLKVDVIKVLSLAPSLPLQANSSLVENAEIDVPLCSSCFKIVKGFSELYQQLDTIRVKVEGRVREVQAVIESVEERQELVQQYRQRVIERSFSPEDLLGASVTENLRKELLEKCLLRKKDFSPKVELARWNIDSVPVPISNDKTDFTVNGFLEPQDAQKHQATDHTCMEGDFDEPILAVTTVSDGDVAFMNLPNGKFQCLVCSKVVSGGSRRLHKLTHSEKRPFSCAHCEDTFRCPRGMAHHQYSHHRHLFFTQLKDSRLNSDAFEKLVSTFFKNLQVTKLPEKHLKCMYCDYVAHRSNTRYVHEHMIRKHMDLLTPMWLTLQEEHLRSNQSRESRQELDENGIARAGNDDDVVIKMETEHSTDDILQEAFNGSDDNEDVNGEFYSDTVKTETVPATGRPQCLLKRTLAAPDNANSNTSKRRRKLKCAYCSKGFWSNDNLQRHRLTCHLTTCFAKYQDPKLTTKQFDEVISKLFESLRIKRGGDSRFQCQYCNFKTKSIIVLHGHKARVHMTQLEPRLKELLAGELAAVKESEFGSGNLFNLLEPMQDMNVEAGFDPLQTASNDGVSFIILPNGRRQCRICSKEVSVHSVKFHRLLHTGKKPYKCSHCDQSFANPRNAKQHTYLHHRSSFFMEHKDPRLSLNAFESVVADLFQNKLKPKAAGGSFTCLFCTELRASTSSYVYGHYIREHMAQLVPMLNDLQETRAADPEASAKIVPGPSRRSRRLRSTVQQQLQRNADEQTISTFAGTSVETSVFASLSDDIDALLQGQFLNEEQEGGCASGSELSETEEMEMKLFPAHIIEMGSAAISLNPASASFSTSASFENEDVAE